MEKTITLTIEEADIARQWFNAVQDLNPSYLMIPDYELSKKIHEKIGIEVPLRILANAEG